NGGLGIFLQSTNYPTGLLPHGSRNNIYGNHSGGSQFGLNVSPGLTESDLDWNDNYWGSVYMWFEPPVCGTTPPNSVFRLVYPGASGYAPAGPMDSGEYVDSSGMVICSSSKIHLASYAPAYIDGTPPLPFTQTFGECEDDFEAENPSGCDGDVNTATGG